MTTGTARLIGALAAAMVVAGWWWSTISTSASDQTGPLALASGGLFVGGTAAALAISNRYLALAQARSAAEGDLRAALAERVPATETIRLVTTAQGTWTHLSSCLLTRYKVVRVASRASLDLACPICRPEVTHDG